MNTMQTVRVAVNGYGVISKRVVDAVALQPDMTLAGVYDVAADWRPRMALAKGYPLYAATEPHARAMRASGLDVAGTLDDLFGQADVVVDCTPKRIAAASVETYRAHTIHFILQGGKNTRSLAIPSWPKPALRVRAGAKAQGSCPATRPPLSAR